MERVGRFGEAVKHGAREALALYYLNRLRRRRLRVLFLIGHMRSGSTLLLHILNTNPEIVGYGETHRCYRNERDLARLAVNVSRAFGQLRISATYVLDKVLYGYIKTSALLARDRTKTIYLLRRPSESLRSILRFHRERGFREPDALDYYLKQLRRMETLASRVGDPRRCFFLTYHQLLERTRPTLSGLQRFLGLTEQLSERYETIWSTGQRGSRGLGDDSEWIHKGHIVRTKDRPRMPLSNASLESARSAFERCRSVMTEACTHLCTDE